MRLIDKRKLTDGKREVYLFGFRLFGYTKRPVVLPPHSFPPSQLANKYLTGLRGIEIGGSAHNQFFLDTLNVNYTDENTCFSENESLLVGHVLKVDIVAAGDNLPLQDNSVDFVISSHVLEHFWDPIKTLKEWMRVVRPGGFVFMIIPHKERTFDQERPRTSLQELVERHNGVGSDPGTHAHFSVWITADVLELCQYLGLNVIEHQDRDDKVGNGFSVVIQKVTHDV
jgi:SAM-dependent methyltransferase